MAVVYSPINEPNDIRLVGLKPGDSTNPIHLTLQHARFSATGQYEALSYTWGRPSDGFKRIHLDGEPVQVGINLFEALKSLRSLTGHNRQLWIDSLCINQADDEERSQQVGRMSEIYSHAEEVLIWLGKEWGNSDLAMASMRKISELASDTAPKDRRLIADYKRHRAAWAAIGKLCSRDYWRRMWIIQEVQLARKLHLHCGTREASWDDLRNMLHLANRCLSCKDLADEKALLDVANSLAARRESHRLKRESHGSTLKELLNDCQESLCTDPRDKVYALVGLASDCRDRELVVDYSKPLVQVYKDVMKLYSLPTSGDWKSRHGQDVVRFSQFLQNILRPQLDQDVKTLLKSRARDSEPIWLTGFHTTAIAQIRQPYSKAALNLTASTIGKIYATVDDIFLAVKDRTPNHEDVSQGISPISKYSFSVTPDDYQQVLLENGQSAIATFAAAKGDVVCQFLGSSLAVVLRSEPSWKIVGTALLLETSDFEPSKPLYLRLNLVVLQHITADNGPFSTPGLKRSRRLDIY